MLLLDIYQLETSESNDDNDPYFAEAADLDSQCLDEARTFYEKLISDNIFAEEAPSFDVLEKIKDSIKKNAESLGKSFRTSALLVQYMSMIEILRKFVRAERTGKWELHLQSIQAMFLCMEISGQNYYNKSGMLYL